MTRSATACPPSTRSSGLPSRARPSRSPSHRAGFTLIEALVALAVAGILLALVLPLVLSQRRVVQLDQARTSANQTLRAVSQLLAADVRIAGERFGEGLALSPIAVSVDGSGDSVVVLRRNLEDALPVCQSVPAGSTVTSIVVADWGPTVAHPQCSVNRTASFGGVDWPYTLDAHRRIAAAQGGVVSAYIFDPASRTGQWFSMRIDGAQGSPPDEVRCDDGCVWATDYEPAANAYIALLDAIEYRLVDGVLQRRDLATGEVLRIASGLEAFEVTVSVAGEATPRTTFADTGAWRSITSLNLDVVVERREGGSLAERSLQTRLFPRNLLSR
ncbi:MAG: prepilin-type N-terminal cleavage/methylation domain-containing protein [Trueperaceae bacterium]|nr:prepilin-type N-terminal cleavage/methylation domain-containing protein [Trueperaceae bacterium]